MLNFSDALRLLEGAGLSLSISRPGELMVIPREMITPQLRALILERKADILVSLAKKAEDGILHGIPSQKAPEGGRDERAAADDSREGRCRKLQHGAHPAALTWLRDHRVELKAAGWTGRELYRRDKSKGLLWVKIWDDRPGMNVEIAPGGVIEFRFEENGKSIKQTAHPRANHQIFEKEH